MEGALPTGNFGSKTRERFEVLKEFTQGGPLMCAEFWVGWCLLPNLRRKLYLGYVSHLSKDFLITIIFLRETGPIFSWERSVC